MEPVTIGTIAVVGTLGGSLAYLYSRGGSEDDENDFDDPVTVTHDNTNPVNYDNYEYHDDISDVTEEDEDEQLEGDEDGDALPADEDEFQEESDSESDSNEDENEDEEEDSSGDGEGREDEDAGEDGVEEGEGTEITYEENDVNEDVEDQSDPTPSYVADMDDLTDVAAVGPAKAQRLENAGYNTPTDLYYAHDENIMEINGFGESVIEQIRDDIGRLPEPEQSA